MMGPVTTSALTLCLVLLAVSARQTDYCYNDVSDPYLYFSSKTAYEFIHPKQHTPENLPRCEPVQMWFLGRHGTRYPGLGNIKTFANLTKLRDQILRNHETGLKEGRLCNSDLDNLQSWQFTVTEDQENILTSQGQEDLEFLARRLKQLYPTLLNTTYKSDLYQFRFTKTQRTQASAENFAKGLFGSSSGVYFPPPLEVDNLIQPYANCTLYQDTMEKSYSEVYKFQDGPLMTNLVQNVSSRLGFRYNLKPDDVFAMFDMCRYDKSWKVDQRSPWCAVFSKEELKLLEYSEDLRYYYKDGYGRQINIDLGCTLIKDLIERFTQLEGDNIVVGQQPVGVFYFSHSSMIHILQSALGVFKDSEALRSDNYDKMAGRQWRISKTGSFATNIAAVFFKCSEGDKNRVLFYQSETPMPICKVGLCSWDELKKKFSSVAEGCDLKFCDPNNGGHWGHSPVSLFSALLLGALPLLITWNS